MYMAICRYDSVRTMEIALESVLDDDFVAGVIAFVSWLHLCYVCTGWLVTLETVFNTSPDTTVY